MLQPLHQNTALSCTQRGPRSFFTAVPQLALNRTIQTPIHNPQTTNQKPKTTNHKPQIANREQQTTNHKPGIIQRWQGRVHTRKILGIGMAVGVGERDVSWLFLSCATPEPQGQTAATGGACVRRHAEACRRAQMCDRSGCGDTWWAIGWKVLELDFGMFIGVRCQGVVFFG